MSEIDLRWAYKMKFFFHELEILFQKKSVAMIQEAKCVSEILFSLFTQSNFFIRS